MTTVQATTVSVLQKSFKAALSDFQGVVSKNHVLPAARGVLLRSEDGRLVLTGTDLDTLVNKWMGAKVEGEGALSFVAPFPAILQLVSEMPDERLDLCQEGQNLVIRWPGGQLTLEPVAHAQDYPPEPVLGPAHEITIPVEIVRAIVRQVLPCCSNEASRPVLQQVCVSARDGAIEVAGADGFRLAVLPLCPWPGEPFSLLTSPRLWTLALKYADKSTTTVSVSLGQRVSRIDVGYATAVLTSNLEGTYPNYRTLIPASFAYSATIARKDLLVAVKRANVVARDASSIVRLIGAAADRLTVSARAEGVGEISAELQARTTGGGFKIADNGSYLVEVLSGYDSEMVTVELNSPSDPSMWQPEGQDRAAAAKVLIMSMFVSW